VLRPGAAARLGGGGFQMGGGNRPVAWPVSAVGDRFEERLEGWLEEPSWDDPDPAKAQRFPRPPEASDSLDDWDERLRFRAEAEREF